MNVLIKNSSSKNMIPSEMLDIGTRYVTNEAFIGPILLISLMNNTYANAVFKIPIKRNERL